MNILYIVNNLTKTSIPWRWAEYFNKSPNLNVKILGIRNLLAIIKSSFSVHVVHGHHIKVMFLFLIINKLLARCKTIYTVHGSYLFLSKFNKILLRFIFIMSDKIVFVNKELYDVIPQNLKRTIDEKNIIILNGVELEYEFKKIDVLKKYNFESDDIIIFHPARFVEEKNHIRLISALENILKENQNIKLVLAGDGKLKDDIREHIKRLDLHKSIKLLGLIERDEVYNFLESCELFVMPSISEGLNIAFLEAISMNCKIVVSNIEQFTYPVYANEIVPSEINIFFTDPFDTKEMEREIRNALNFSKNTSNKASCFSLDAMQQKYEKLYKELIQ